MVLLLILITFAGLHEVRAASPSPGSLFTYEGLLTDNAGIPITTPQTLTFKVILPPSCIAYEETQNLTPGASGEFSVMIGAGTRTDSTGNTAARIFAASGNIACEGGSPQNVSGFTTRLLRIRVGSTDLTPDVTIGNIPVAINAQNLGDSPADSHLRVSSGATTPLTQGNFIELLNLVNGVSANYEKTGSLNGSTLPALSNGQVLGWNGSQWSAITPMTSFTEADPLVKPFAKTALPVCAPDQFLQSDGAGSLVCVPVPTSGAAGTVTNVTAGVGLVNSSNPGAAITTTGTLAVDVGTSANKIVQLEADAKLPALDGSKLTNVVATSFNNTASINTSGSITAPQINTRNLYIENISANRVTLKAPNTLIDYTLILPGAPGSSGQILGLSALTGQLEWKTPPAGNAITTLQGDVTSSNFNAGSVDVAVTKINGIAVDTAFIGDDQKYLKYTHGTGWQPHFIKLSDLRNASGTASAFSAGIAGCTSAQTLVWTSLTDQFSCQNIFLPAANVTGVLSTAQGGTGTNSVGQGLFLAGPSSAGPAAPTFRTIAATDLPASASYWQPAPGGISYNGTAVGIGTATPQAGLDVATTGTTGSAIIVPRDNTANRPTTPVGGMIRYNNDTSNLEAYQGSTANWNTLPGTVARVNLANQSAAKASTTIFTPTATDFYNVCVFFQVHAAGGTGNLTPMISFTSGADGNLTTGTLTGSIDISSTGWRGSCTPIFAFANGAINYYTDLVGAPTAALKYSLYIRITNMR